MKNKEIVDLCKKMSILLKSGCEITRILYILEQESSKKVSKLIRQISNHIQNGNTVTESFQKTESFSEFFISTLMAGEISGNLDNVMDDLANYYDKEQKLKSKIITILIYPIILIIVSICTLLFILIFVIPNFQIIFESNNIEPPFLTQLLISASEFVRTKPVYLLAVNLILILITCYIVKCKGKVEYFKNYIQLKAPFVKDIILLIVTTRFCRTLSILIETGVQIVSAIEISSKVTQNKIVHKKLMVSKEYIKMGNSVSESIYKADVFSKSFISMLKIGEESGNLDNTLSVANDFYTEELNTRVEQLIKLVEPTITVVIGLIVGVFVIAMIMPMFDAINSI